MLGPQAREIRLRFASALSTHEVAEQAVIELIDQIGPAFALPDQPADWVTVFASADHAQALGEMGAAVGEATGASVVMGATMGGVVGKGREVEKGSAVSILAGRLPGAKVVPFTCEEVDWKEARRSPEAMRQALGVAADSAEDPLRAIVLVADPFSTPTVRLLPAFNAAFPAIPVVGGLVGAATKPGGNRLVLGEGVYTTGVVGLAIRGDVAVHTTLSQGCRAIGCPLVITKAKRHVVQELGGEPALQRLRETLADAEGADRERVEEGGLMVGRVIDEYKGRFGRDDFLIRAVVGVDPEAGYLAIGDPQVRVGQTIQFHVRDQRAAVDDLALLMEGQKLHGPAAGALLFTCHGRGTTLFDKPDVDAQAIGEALGEVPLAGCFAAGEFGPIAGRNFVHGHAASLLVFREASP